MIRRPPTGRTRILIVDDHGSVRIGLRFLLSFEPEFEIVGEACSVATALRAIGELAPDIVILDCQLGAERGELVLDTLNERPHRPRVLMLSMHDQRVVAEELIRRGADGYIMKESPTADFLVALHRIGKTLRTSRARAGNELPPLR